MSPGCLTEVGAVAASFQIHRALLVSDQGMAETPWLNKVAGRLEDAGLQVLTETAVEQNPRHHTVDAIAQQARTAKVDLVVGLGGGSVLDTAKAVAMLIKNAGSCLDFEGKNRFNYGSAPFLALPTTCGTGSEVTWVSVISDLDARRKISVKGEAMFPDVALVDAEVLSSLPSGLIATTGMDAFTHAIEAYTAACANPISDSLAEQAIRLILNYLPRLYRDAGDETARLQCMRASTLAGMAFGNADVGGVHCLSETIGGLFDVPHGLANAILLLPVMESHEPTIRSKLAGLMQILDGPAASRRTEEALSRLFLSRIQNLLDALDIPSFSSLDIEPEAFSIIAAGAVKNNSNASNPRPMTASDYLQILHSTG